MPYPKPVRIEWNGDHRCVEKRIYENGSCETWWCHSILYVEAPNPFGGKWTIRYKTGIHNGAWRSDHVKRRGKCWTPVLIETGWSWVEERGN